MRMHHEVDLIEQFPFLGQLLANGPEPTGSLYIVQDRPEAAKDRDWIACCTPVRRVDLEGALSAAGWTVSGYDGAITSFRMGEDNLIVTYDETYYLRWCAATEYCRDRGVTDKPTRVAIFRQITGDDANGTPPSSE